MATYLYNKIAYGSLSARTASRATNDQSRHQLDTSEHDVQEAAGLTDISVEEEMTRPRTSRPDESGTVYATNGEEKSDGDGDTHDGFKTYSFGPIATIRSTYTGLSNRIGRPATPAGWRRGARIAMFGSAATLLTNIIVLIWILAGGQKHDTVPWLFQGSCSKAANINTGVHVLINVVSTLLLGGSNYCMQCLVAPSRADIDAAHARNESLNIGVPSLHNLFRISQLWRKALWLVLILSSLPLHVLFNSVLFVGRGVNNYDVSFVKPDFEYKSSLNDANIMITGVAQISDSENQVTPMTGELEVLALADCIKAYAHQYISNHRNLIIVTANESVSHSTAILSSELPIHEVGLHLEDDFLRVNRSLLAVQGESYNEYSGNGDAYNPFNWICGEATATSLPCYRQINALLKDPDTWRPSDFKPLACISEKSEERCHVHVNVDLLWIVCACNLIKALIIGYIAYSKALLDPLCTLGDAATSFLVNPDLTTRDAWSDYLDCGVGARSDKYRSIPRLRRPRTDPGARNYQLRHGTTSSHYVWTVLYFAGCIVTIGILLKVAFVFYPGNHDIPALSALGIGAQNSVTIIGGWGLDDITDLRSRIMANILVANSPQIIFSILYFAVNSLSTNMSITSEWSRFGYNSAFKHSPKTFRTSRPRGLQRSTYFLSLPYRFAVPIMALSALIHWLISETIFLTAITSYSVRGVPQEDWYVKLLPQQIRQEWYFDTITCGYSMLGMIILIIIGSVICIAFCTVGFIRIDSSLPLVGNDSQAISAACHLPDGTTPEEREELVQGPVVWGHVDNANARDLSDSIDDTREEGNRSYCGFARASGHWWGGKIGLPRTEAESA